MNEHQLNQLKSKVGFGGAPQRYWDLSRTLGFICVGIAIYSLFNDEAYGVMAGMGGTLPIAVGMGRRAALEEVRAILESAESDAHR